jgi:hypothetical protein
MMRMSAQLVDTIEELVFTDAEDSVLLILCDGRVVEFFGDGTIQKRGAEIHEVVVLSI